MVLSNGVFFNGDSKRKRPLENGHCPPSSSNDPIKFKRRRVSAVRDFPPGCGRNVPRIDSSRPQDENVGPAVAVADISNTADAAAGAEVNGVRVYENGAVSDKEVQSPDQLEMAAPLDDLVGRVVAQAGIVVNVEPLGIELPKDSESGALEVSKDLEKVDGEFLAKEFHDGELNGSVKEETHNRVISDAVKEEEGGIGAPVKEDLVGVEVQMTEKIASVLVNKNAPEIGASGTTDGAVQVGSAKVSSSSWGPKKKFKQRRVSATRDFPPFCGRNASPPTEEHRLRIISGSKSTNVAKEVGLGSGTLGEGSKVSSKGGMSNVTVKAECGTSSGTLKTSGKEPERNVPDGNVQKKSESKEIVLASSLIHRGEEDVQGLAGVGKEMVVYSHETPKKSHSSDVVLASELDRVIVQGLMSAPNCPWRQGKGVLTSPDNATSRRKMKKIDVRGNSKPKSESRTIIKLKPMKNSNSAGKSTDYGGTTNLDVKDEENYVGHNEDAWEDSPASRGPCDFDVSLPPFGPNSSTNGDARNRVRETLRLFQAICRKLLQGEEAKSRKGESNGKKGKEHRRIDLDAAKVIKAKGKEVNKELILGEVPGVEVGDEFQYRVELTIVGIHRSYQAGIDSIKHGGQVVATSIVASGGYPDELDFADVLIYSGQGGVGKDKQPEDQKLIRGNLALKNSISAKTPVRVVRGSTVTKAAEPGDARGKEVKTYVYDGLYTVDRYWQEVGPSGKLVFKFELNRVPGQPELAWKEVKKSKKFKTREGLCVDDISGGKELFPICGLNTVDNEKPPPFNYTTKMIYSDWYSPRPPKGCDCSDGCMDSQRCSCTAKNEGEIPYNCNGAIVESKPLVYECGPCCKCPPSCYNRVTQHGIKIQLEIFKTESRGWGVRSLNSIPSGSFICEYIGELLEDKEAEKRTGNDEYLFDIGQNYNDCSLNPDIKPISSDAMEEDGFTVDAAHFGNVGRFINHSCSPNLYAQNVIYDHDDKRIPHIMLFAAENIPPLKELTYHYNYSVDQIRDTNGNIKMKSCYCGSAECTGRMY